VAVAPGARVAPGVDDPVGDEPHAAIATAMTTAASAAKDIRISILLWLHSTAIVARSCRAIYKEVIKCMTTSAPGWAGVSIRPSCAPSSGLWFPRDPETRLFLGERIWFDRSSVQSRGQGGGEPVIVAG
jgi:hypothetical protein